MPNLALHLIKALLIVIMVAATYVTWLDYRIYNEFEGRKWSVPARVFTRPAEIYQGQLISLSDLISRLNLSGYRQTSVVTAAGQYHVEANRLTVYLRPFKYWDGEVVAQLYEIEFQNGAITHISNTNSDTNVAILRIEPVLIGKIYPDHNEDRVLISLSEVPTFLIQALISVEDRDYYRHLGIDFKGILRAAWINIQRGELSQGGSTITQQLIKNYFLTRDRTLSRKINEIIMAMLLERRYSKDEILTGYLNEVYLGQDGARAIHGFGTAAEFYFNKPLAELEPDQLALLAAMVRGASFYNPRRSPERAQARRNLVLDIMVEQGNVTVQNSEVYKAKPLGVTENPVRPGSQYAAFLDLAKRQLLNQYDLNALKNDGLNIYTTLLPALQVNMDDLVKARLRGLENRKSIPLNSLEAAVTVINPVNGDVLGLYGGTNYLYSGFNRAIEARRPVGSLIKPFVYLAALTQPQKFGLLSGLADEKIIISQDNGEEWRPQNYDRIEHGTVSLIEALANSYNLATVRLGMELGLDNVVTVLEQSGVISEVEQYPSLLLGALELTPMQVAQLYQIIANGGYRVPLNSIQEVLDVNGVPLQRQQLNVEQVWDEKTVFLLNYILAQVTRSGTARQLSNQLGKSLQLAGKTGTSDSARDSWFAGYGEDFLAVTWIGKDDNTTTSLTGASAAMPLWADIAGQVDFKGLSLLEPIGIHWKDNVQIQYKGVCTQMGKIPFIIPDRTDPQLLCQSEQRGRTLLDNIKGWFQ